jgi:hypothetical protein
MQQASPVWRYWMQLRRKYGGAGCNTAAQLKVMTRKYGGAGCSIEAQDGKYEDTGCNLNPEKHSKSKLLNSKSPALFSYPLLIS